MGYLLTYLFMFTIAAVAVGGYTLYEYFKKVWREELGE